MKGPLLVCAAALVLANAAPAKAQLVGAFRTEFIAGAEKSCLQNQTSKSENEGFSKEILAGYCTCNAQYIADRTTNDQVLLSAGDIAKGVMPQWFSNLAKPASAFCIANLKQYVGPK